MAQLMHRHGERQPRAPTQRQQKIQPGEQRDRALSVACAWPHAQRAAALALEALVGRLVCIKDRYGNMAIGSLPSLESNCDEFMRRYSFTISHTNREEAITLDP